MRTATVLLIVALASLAGAGQGRRGRPADDGYRNPDYDGRFVFTRVRYGGRGWGGGSWAHDYPRADQHLPHILKDLTAINPRTGASNVLDLEDPDIFLNPILYVSEPGFWTITDDGARNLRAHLAKGGMVIFDDFEGPAQWSNMEAQMHRAVPELRFIEIDVSHPIFHTFFEMKTIDFPHPTVNVMPTYLAMFEDNDPRRRIVALANHDNDLAEYWEWSATGMFPVNLTSEAYKLGVNYIVYGLTR
jgi:hypothetical protein